MTTSSSETMGMPSNAGQDIEIAGLDSSAKHKTFHIAGLPVHVFGLDSIRTTEVTVLFFLHGRLGKWEDGIKFIEQMLSSVKSTKRSLIVVTFDQRKLTSARANTTWADKPANPLHAADMHSIQMGTARDVSLLIDYLEPYVFPEADHRISQYLCAGISLGGHSTWLVLSHEPRIQAGCPIIGCPDFMSLMTGRAERMGGMTKRMMPDSLCRAVRALDPKVANLRGKRVLILSGERDKLVPYDKGATFVEELKHVAGSVQVEIYPGVGHRCTEAMIEELARFLTREMGDGRSSPNL